MLVSAEYARQYPSARRRPSRDHVRCAGSAQGLGLGILPALADAGATSALSRSFLQPTAAMFTAAVPGGSGRRAWTISYNMQQLVLSCVCVTLMLHCIGVVAAGRLSAGGPTTLQLGLYYYSSGFMLILYAAAVTVIVRARPVVQPDDTPLQQSAFSASDRGKAATSAAILVAACCGPPLFLVLLMRPVPALIVLACLAVAGGLSAAVWWCWSRLAAGRAADAEPRQQFVSLAPGAYLRAQVIQSPSRGCL